MNKLFKKIGLSAGVAFAFMFAASVSLVAQEKVVVSDNVEVTTLLEESNVELAKKMADNVKPTIAKHKKVLTMESRSVVSLADTWVSTDQIASAPIDFKITEVNVSPPDPGTGAGCRTANPGDLCSALLQYDPNEISDPSVLEGLDFSAAQALFPSLTYTTVGRHP